MGRDDGFTAQHIIYRRPWAVGQYSIWVKADEPYSVASLVDISDPCDHLFFPDSAQVVQNFVVWQDLQDTRQLYASWAFPYQAIFEVELATVPDFSDARRTTGADKIYLFNSARPGITRYYLRVRVSVGLEARPWSPVCSISLGQPQNVDRAFTIYEASWQRFKSGLQRAVGGQSQPQIFLLEESETDDFRHYQVLLTARSMDEAVHYPQVSATKRYRVRGLSPDYQVVSTQSFRAGPTYPSPGLNVKL